LQLDAERLRGAGSQRQGAADVPVDQALMKGGWAQQHMRNDLLDILSNAPEVLLATALILAGVITFLRKSHDKGLDEWDYLLIMGLAATLAIFLFSILLRATM
jgi:hypothetical protein